ncbi:MAG: hypothetical protein CL840_18655 [Crocinitomicaceae bacterium]|nr:hypothetical protein [Crocinitomicaceae bacterium]
MYSIIDIETNGLNSKRGKITEIAIFKHDGEKIVEEFQTLINPETPIPYEITRITGISSQMVEDAPKFYQVAKEILEITEDSVFVAHNVNFDYGFIQEEFKNLGYTFKRKKLCTVKQSKLLLPGHRSYSLGRICKDLGIPIEGRHRAAGDARATVTLFEKLLEVDSDLGTKRKASEQLSKYLHPEFDISKILEAPKKTGVYYLFNEKGDIIYVGKSTNIRTRLNNHLRQPKTNKAMRMHNEVADVDYRVTGSELMALLVESEEIKRIKPKFNSALKRNNFPFGIIMEEDLFGYMTLSVVKYNQSHNPYSTFTTKASAQNRLEQLSREYRLCLGLCGLQKCGSGCVTKAVEECNGAALYEEEPTCYNERVREALESLTVLGKDALIIDRGKDEDSLSAILIQGNKYIGYGIFDPEFQNNKDEILEQISYKEDNPDSRYIIASYLKHKRVKQIIPLG